MLALERQKIILDYLENNQIASTKFLSDLTHASLATVRRDRKSTRLNSSHSRASRMPSSA